MSQLQMSQRSRRAPIVLTVAAMAMLRVPLVLPAQTPDLASHQVAGQPGTALDSILKDFQATGFSGTVLVISQNKVSLLAGYGLARREDSLPNRGDTRFEIGSITKTFTAAAILRLAETGRLRLDDPLSRFFPGAPAAKAVATVHHLATHTGGLVRAGAALTYDRGREAFLASVWAAPQESTPGTSYRYTNAGYSVLAAIVEVVSGDSFETFVRRELLEPAGLGHLQFADAVTPDERLASGYREAASSAAPVASGPYDWGYRGAAGLVATVGDLYRWHQALRQGRVLGPDAMAVMFASWPDEGYGWHVDATNQGTGMAIHKGGGLPSFATQLLWFPGPDVFIAWASNDTSAPWRRRLNDALKERTLCHWRALASGLRCP